MGRLPTGQPRAEFRDGPPCCRNVGGQLMSQAYGHMRFLAPNRMAFRLIDGIGDAAIEERTREHRGTRNRQASAALLCQAELDRQRLGAPHAQVRQLRNITTGRSDWGNGCRGRDEGPGGRQSSNWRNGTARPVTCVVQCERRFAGAGARHADHAARRSARDPASSRHQEGMRPRSVWRMHSPRQRRADQFMPDPCGHA
jgi:hypothetical protein